MYERSSCEMVRHLRTLYQFGVAAEFGDEQLLERFLSRRDEVGEEAFAELVQRHGPMVLGVCRRVLGDAHDAEDAFQATFLVLARKASTVVRREKLASWLYGVAVRTAREARIRTARRRAREERVSTPIGVDSPDGAFPEELRAILDEELARLPARHRGPVVMCELEGMPRPAAARRLGIPEGTLSSRLSRAKARLRERLAARGVSLPAAALSAALIHEARAVTLPLSLIESTVQAATIVAAGPIAATAASAISASAASLSEGVIRTMLVAKIKGVVLAVGTMTAFVSGAFVLGQAPSGTRTEETKVQEVTQVPAAPAETKVTVSNEDVARTAVLETKLDRILEALERMASAETRREKSGSPIPLASVDEVATRVSRPLEDLPNPGTTDHPRRVTKVATSEAPAPQQGSRHSHPTRLLGPDASSSTRTNSGGPATPAPEYAPGPTAVVGPTNDSVPMAPIGNPMPEVAPIGTPMPDIPPKVTPGRQNVSSLSDRLLNVENELQQVLRRLDQMEKRCKALDARVGGVETEDI